VAGRHVDGMSAERTINPRTIRVRILNWYANNKRDLPWRQTRDPYRIWVSEIMLQQTRVAAVIPYYDRFLERFPSVQALASAPESDLLAAWAGLGYYSRARNLQKAAKKVIELGRFPEDYASIRDLPGVGDYTAAAIASIAFELPHAVLDGNVVRVLSRLTGECGDIRSSVVRQRLRTLADRLIDTARPGDFNQGLMELGATVCMPKQPQCLLCPLSAQCVARKMGQQDEIPSKSLRPAPRGVEKTLLVIERDDNILAWRRPAESRRLAGFWELPESDQLRGARLQSRSGAFRHSIVNTTYRIEVFRATLELVPKGFHWLAMKKLDEIPLSTTAKKALACLGERGAESKGV